MATISQTTFLSAFSLINTSEFLNKIRLISKMVALLQIMAWRRTGHKLLSEAMLVCCTDV